MSVQFTIPRVVANAIDGAAIRARARTAGVISPSFEMNDKNAGPSQTRVTCSEPVTRALIDEFRLFAAVAEKANDRDLLVSCSTAVNAALEAIEKAKGVLGDQPASRGIGRAMGDRQ